MAESVNLLFEAWCARSRDPAPCAPRGPPKYVPCFLVCSDRACLADTYSSTTDSRLHSFTAFMVFTLTFLDFHASPLSSFICSCSHFFYFAESGKHAISELDLSSGDYALEVSEQESSDASFHVVRRDSSALRCWHADVKLIFDSDVICRQSCEQPSAFRQRKPLLSGKGFRPRHQRREAFPSTASS